MGARSQGGAPQRFNQMGATQAAMGAPSPQPMQAQPQQGLASRLPQPPAQQQGQQPPPVQQRMAQMQKGMQGPQMGGPGGPQPPSPGGMLAGMLRGGNAPARQPQMPRQGQLSRGRPPQYGGSPGGSRMPTPRGNSRRSSGRRRTPTRSGYQGTQRQQPTTQRSSRRGWRSRGG